MAEKRHTKGQARKSIQVCAHWQGLENPILMGILYAAPSRGKEVFTFGDGGDTGVSYLDLADFLVRNGA